MSEDGSHVHGTHDHAPEHEAEHGGGMAGQLAVITAVLEEARKALMRFLNPQT